MSNKSVPLSVRLSQEDAAFIAGLKAPDAVTMSEKVRYLVGAERIRSEQAETFEGVHDQVAEMVNPLMQKLRLMERSTGRSLPVLTLIAGWLPKMVAELAQGQEPEERLIWSEDDLSKLEDVERESIELVIAFLPVLNTLLAEQASRGASKAEKKVLAALLEGHQDEKEEDEER